VKKRHGLNK